MSNLWKMKQNVQQECIPVGCVPFAAVATGGCIPACTGQGDVSQHALGRGCLPGGVYPGWCLPRRRGCLPRGCLPHTPSPLWTEWQMPVKTWPCRNYVADGTCNKFEGLEVKHVFVTLFTMNMDYLNLNLYLNLSKLQIIVLTSLP